MPDLNLQSTELIIVAAVALTMLLQAIVLLATFVVLRKTIRTLHDELDETRTGVMRLMEKVEPLIESAREFLTHTAPKIESTVTDIAAIAQKLRAETNDVQAAASEIVERARRQGARMDSMMTRTLDVVDHAATFMTDAVGKPMRQLSAVLASAKAVIDSLRSGPRDSRTNPDQSNGEQDYYV
jgi:methyl-accepting chemotaxis protein